MCIRDRFGTNATPQRSKVFSDNILKKLLSVSCTRKSLDLCAKQLRVAVKDEIKKRQTLLDDALDKLWKISKK